jgi:hypothetical protein
VVRHLARMEVERRARRSAGKRAEKGGAAVHNMCE